MMRRTAHQLVQALHAAKTSTQKANAFYDLAVFHDNNNRESEAIPFYQKAIRLGLGRKIETMARAWLASSLYKTGNIPEAKKQCERAQKMARDPELLKFLEGLHGRIHGRMNPK